MILIFYGLYLDLNKIVHYILLNLWIGCWYQGRLLLIDEIWIEIYSISAYFERIPAYYKYLPLKPFIFIPFTLYLWTWKGKPKPARMNSPIYGEKGLNMKEDHN